MLWRSGFRYLLRHPWLMGLSVLGVALGVAVVVAIDLANASAQRAFELSADAVTGRATHQVASATGGTLPDTLYRRLRVEEGFRQSAPVVEGYATTTRGGGRTLQLLGVDPLAEAPFRPYVGQGAVDLGVFMAVPRTALLSTGTADALGLALDDTLQVRIDGVAHTLRVAGLIAPADARSAQATQNLVVMDVGNAQALLGLAGRLSRIDLILPDGDAGDARRARVEAVLPPGAEVIRSSARTATIDQMTRAFELNLTALSYLALVVGMFLIYNTMTFSVVQRRPLVGRLRALGVTRREVFALVTGEALAIGAVGTLLGLLLGVVLGRGLVQLVTQTINDLYFVVTVRGLSLDPWTLVKGAVLGLGATLAAAAAPAREATNAPATTVLQRSAQESRVQRLAPRLAAAGVLLGAAGAGLLAVPGGGIVLSYAALLTVLLAFALATPLVVVAFGRLARVVLGRLVGVLGKMAAQGVVTTLSRTGVATAALMIAIAATVGVGVMVSSFRQTVVRWLDYSLQADVYVQPPSLVFRGGTAAFDPATASLLAATPGAAGAYSVRRVTVTSETGRTDLVAVSRSPNAGRTYQFKDGGEESLEAIFGRDDAVIVSEPYAYRHGVGVGDALRLQTDRGPRTFTVAGVFYDYGSDLGVVMMGRDAYETWFDDRALSGLALYAEPGVPADTLMARVQDRVPAGQEVIVRSNRGLRDVSLEVFDRTFTITAVLRLLAVLVAFVGVLSALMALQLERARELAVMRANGMTPGQVGRYVTTQTGLMGLIAGLLSLPLGLVLAYVLIYVINRRSFGWTLQFEVPPAILLQALLLAVAAALLAGLYPAWKMARANPALALREE